MSPGDQSVEGATRTFFVLITRTSGHGCYSGCLLHSRTETTKCVDACQETIHCPLCSMKKEPRLPETACCHISALSLSPPPPCPLKWRGVLLGARFCKTSLISTTCAFKLRGITASKELFTRSKSFYRGAMYISLRKKCLQLVFYTRSRRRRPNPEGTPLFVACEKKLSLITRPRMLKK